MIVHLWGTVAEVEPILELARNRGLRVVEDAAHALAVRRHGRHAGTFGDAGAFSFFADKSITTGEGGFVVTADGDIHDRLLHLRNQGRRDRGDYRHPQVGYNFRITDLQAAVGLVQLDKLPRVQRLRQALVRGYRERLDGLHEVRWFEPPAGSEWIPYRAPVLCDRATELIEHLRRDEIEPRTWFHPIHTQPCFSELVQRQLGRASAEDVFPNTIRACERGLLLPCFPTMTEEQLDLVCRSIREFYGAG